MEAPEKKDCPAQTVLSMKHTGSHADIGGVYHKLYQWASDKKVKLAGPGFTVFLNPPSEFDPQSGSFEVCLPVESPPQTEAGVEVKEIPAATVAYVEVKGPYSEIPAHYAEFLAWISSEGWEIVGPPREVYIKHPDAQGGGDPSEFITEIQFPVRW